MGKFFGIVGFVQGQKDPNRPGITVDVPTEIEYGGEVIRHIRRWQPASDSVVDDISIDDQISILADPYAFENFSHIRYVERFGTLWKVTSAEPQYPRIILSLGGVYNGVHGQKTGAPSDSDGSSGV